MSSGIRAIVQAGSGVLQRCLRWPSRSRAAAGEPAGRNTEGRPHSPIGTWLERLVVPTLVALFVLDAGLRASIRPFWFDELLSYHLSRLPDLGSLWAAWRQGADGQPPLTHLLIRFSHALLGEGELATRLPSLLGFGAMSVAIYCFIGRRAGRLYGVAAVLFAWNTWGYEYAYEARPYALLMGLTGIAFLCWRAAIEGRSRRWALAGLGLSLAALVSVHYYAGLLLIPLVAGELVRAYQRRKIDRSLWCMIALSPLVLLAYLPLILSLRAGYQANFWSPVEWIDTFGFYLFLLAPAGICTTLALLTAVVADWTEPSRPGQRTGNSECFPKHEIAAVCALAALPVVYVLATMLFSGAFVYRHALAALFGISCLFGMVLRDWLGDRRGAITAVCVVFAVGFLATRLAPTIQLASGTTPLDARAALLQQLDRALRDSEEPVVVSAPNLYLSYSHYAPASLRRKLVYPADLEKARKFTGTDSSDVSLMKLAPWASLRVPSYESFRQQEASFFIIHRRYDRFDWIVPSLEAAGEPLRVIREGETYRLLHCCEKNREPEPPSPPDQPEISP